MNAPQLVLTALIGAAGLLVGKCSAQSATNGPPSVSIRPTNQLAPIFGWTTFTAKPGGATPLSYQWRLNGVDLPDETNATLLLGPLSSAQSGYYSVVVSNAFGQASSEKVTLGVAQAVLSTNTLAGASDLKSNQTFLLQFTNLVAADTWSGWIVTGLEAGGKVVEAPYPSPALTSVSVLGGASSAVETSGVAVEWPATTSGGSTTAIGSNVVAMSQTILGSAALLLHSNGAVSTSGGITVLPAGLSNVVAVSVGDTTLSGDCLALRANGTVAEWKPGGSGQLITNGLTNIIAISAGDGGNLALRADGTVAGWNNFPADPFPGESNFVAIAAGKAAYLGLQSDGTVRSGGSQPIAFPFPITNAFYIAVDSFYTTGLALLGNGGPGVTVQPGNQFTNVGGTVWLHARAAGIQPMSYQWQLNGASVPGATNADLIITNLSPAEFGYYRAVIANAFGAVTTGVANVSAPNSSTVPTTNLLGQALNDTNVVWTTYGNADWFGQSAVTHDGILAAQSGAITNNEESILQTVVSGPGVVSFWWKMSSEQYFDVGQFLVNGFPAAAISGEVDWQETNFFVGPGLQRLLWIYEKDADVSDGQDALWVDQFSFAPGPAALGAPVFLPGGNFGFSFYATNGAMAPVADATGLTFEVSSNLIDWTSATNSVIGGGGGITLLGAALSNVPAQFFRLKQ